MTKSVRRNRVLARKKPQMGLLKNTRNAKKRKVEKEKPNIASGKAKSTEKSNSDVSLAAVVEDVKAIPSSPSKTLRSNPVPLISIESLKTDLPTVLISPLKIGQNKSSKISLSLSKSRLATNAKSKRLFFVKSK